MQNFSHHVIHANIAQKRSFKEALANATGYFEPGAKLVFGTYSTSGVRVEVPKEFNGLLWYASLAQSSPKFALRNAIKALLEINVDRVQASFRTSASLDQTL